MKYTSNANLNHNHNIINKNKTENNLFIATTKYKKDKKLRCRIAKEKKLQNTKSNDNIDHNLVSQKTKNNRGFLSEVVNRNKIKFLIIEPRKTPKNEIVEPNEQNRLSERVVGINKNKKNLTSKNIMDYKKKTLNIDISSINSNNSIKNNLDERKDIYAENPLTLKKKKTSNSENQLTTITYSKINKPQKTQLYTITATAEKISNNPINLTNSTTIASTQPSVYKNKQATILNYFPKHVFWKNILNNINLSSNISSNNISGNINNNQISKSLSKIINKYQYYKINTINRIQKHYISNNNNSKIKDNLLTKNKNESENQKNLKYNDNSNKNNLKNKIRNSKAILSNSINKKNNTSYSSNNYPRINSSILIVQKQTNKNCSACADNIKDKFKVNNLKNFFENTTQKLPNVNSRNTKRIEYNNNIINICQTLSNPKKKRQKEIINNNDVKSNVSFNLINIIINNNYNLNDDNQCQVLKTENKLQRCKKNGYLLIQNSNFEVINGNVIGHYLKKYAKKKENAKKTKFVLQNVKNFQIDYSKMTNVKHGIANRNIKQCLKKIENKSDNHLFNVNLIKGTKKTNKNDHSHRDLFISTIKRDTNHSMDNIPRKRSNCIISKYYTPKSNNNFIPKRNVFDLLDNNIPYNKKHKEFEKYFHLYKNREKYSSQGSFKINKFVKIIFPKKNIEKFNNLCYKYRQNKEHYENNCNRNSKYFNKNNYEKNETQIPVVAEENTHRISLKTTKYNECTFINQYFVVKLFDILSKTKILNIFLNYLTKEDLFHLSTASNFFNDICIHKVNQIIINNILLKDNREIIKKIWQVDLIKNSILYTKNDQIEKIYTENLKNNKYDKEIMKDLSRTFPDDISFKNESDNYKKLFNVLKAYSNYNKKIGYVQGMNFIVAKLILFFQNEKDIFIQLDSLVNKLNFSGIIGIINKELNLKMKILQMLLDKLNPKISKLMKNKKVEHDTFTASWIITLFSNNFRNNKLLLKLWTFSLIYGWKFIYLFIISIFDCFQEKCEKYEMFEFVQFMKNLFQLEEFNMNFQKIIKMTFNYMAKWKNIVKDIGVYLK